ncbi:MAG: hypothetical protein Q9187_005289 [Circinaria calcarea]
MVSLGYSIGDFITVGHLAWNVYRSCKDAPGSFSNIFLEVLSLHAVLKEVGEILSDGDDGSISAAQSARLSTLKDGYEGILEDLQDLIKKYESLDTKSKRAWDQLGWGLQNIAELRYISTSQLTVERTLNKFLQEFRDGKHEGSVISNQTVESLSTDEKEIWRSIRKELDDIGVTVAAFEANKTFIIEWFKQSIATGAFDEEIPDAEPDTVSSTHHVGNGSGQAIQKLGSSSASQINAEGFNPPAGSDAGSLNLHNPQLTQFTTLEGPIEKIAIRRTRSKTVRGPKVSPKVYGKSKRASRLTSLLVRAFGLDDSLYDAARDGNLPKVQELLRIGANIERGRGEDSPLCIAASMGHIEVVELLLEKGANIKEGSSFHRTPLYRAAAHGHITMVELLLRSGAVVRSETFNSAVIKGNEAAVQLLLEWGADVNTADSSSKRVLQAAASNGFEMVVRLLLDHGADIESSDESGRTALLEAAREGHVPVVRLLLEQGADIEATDKTTWTALHHASFGGHSTLVQFLLKMGAGPNVKACYRESSGLSNAVWTPLHIAAEKGHEAVAQSLLRDGKADVELRTQYLDTALHKAARRGRIGVVRVLLDHGARIETENRAKETPLSLAIERQHRNVEGLLNYALIRRQSYLCYQD